MLSDPADTSDEDPRETLILAEAEKFHPAILDALRGDITQRQLARILGVSLGTAYTRVQGAKRYLRNLKRSDCADR